jgi:hypothetical protein
VARQLDPAAIRLKVSVAAWSSLVGGSGGLQWEDRDDLRARVRRTSGSQPAQCRIWADRYQFDPGPIFQPVPGEARQTRILHDRTGETIAPFGIREWDFIRVSAEGFSAPVFVGVVSGWRWNRQAAQIEVVAQDYRLILNRVVCRGSYWYRIHLGGDPVWIDDWGPHFNAEGRKDQQVSAAGRLATRFCTPDFTIDADNYAAAWRCGDALNCLRQLFTIQGPLGLDQVDRFIDWPEAKADGGLGGWDWLFTDPETREDRNLGELDCRGKKLGWAIDQIVSAAGPYDWTLDYQETGKAKLRVFPTLEGTFTDVDLSLGATGKSRAADPPDVDDCDFEIDWTEAVKTVRAVGARKRVDLTLQLALASPNVAPNTDASSALVPLWGSAEQAAWLALPESSPEKNSQAFQDVFCTYGAPAGLDWSSWLGAAFRDGAREALALLVSRMLSETGAAGRPVLVPFRVWRYKGEAWEALPGVIGATLLKDRVGFRLAADARAYKRREPGGTAERWTWYLDGATPRLYVLRVSLCVEANERLVEVSEDDTLNWPPGEFCLAAGDKYRYDLQKLCVLRASGGLPVVNGGADKIFDLATDGAVRWDNEELAALAYRKYRQIAVPAIRGQIPLVGLRGDLKIGHVVGKLYDSGNARHVLPDVELCRAVRSIEYDDDAQVTKLGFEGV